MRSRINWAGLFKVCAFPPVAIAVVVLSLFAGRVRMERWLDGWLGRRLDWFAYE